MDITVEYKTPEKGSVEHKELSPDNKQKFKKGDFLKDEFGNIFICSEAYKTCWENEYLGIALCVLFNNMMFADKDWIWRSCLVSYATEEEKQKLLKVINDNGYVWDAEKLELRKNEPAFKPFDKVLVRDVISGVWMLAQYAFEDKGTEYKYNTVGGEYWQYCIPYKGNEHLLGTTENCK